MPALVELQVELDSGRLPRIEHCHGMISHWLESDVALAEHRSNRKAWRLAEPRWVARRMVSIRLGLMTDEILGLLRARAVSEGPSIRLGRSSGQLVAPSSSPFAAESHSEWTDLLDVSSAETKWRFTFLSPVAFRSGNLVNPLPEPRLIFGHLRDRWQAFAPRTLQPFVDLSTCGLAVSELSGTTQIRELRGRSYPGFVGTVEIRATAGDARDHRVLDALARLVPFAGVGANTTTGMGDAVCERLPRDTTSNPG